VMLEGIISDNAYANTNEWSWLIALNCGHGESTPFYNSCIKRRD
jgi:hypothetical protein